MVAMATGAPLPGWAAPVFDLLRQRRGRGWQYTALCPAHDDHFSSMSASMNDEGDRILFHCHRSCTADAIVAALGLDMTDLFVDTSRFNPSNPNRNNRNGHHTPQPPRPAVTAPTPLHPTPKQALAAGGKITAIYTYTDHEGNPVAEKGRCELPEVGPDGKHKKTFLWRRYGETRWAGLEGIPTASLALWGWETVLAAPKDATVYFCEGEKAVEACRAAGLVAVTFAGGASAKDFGTSLDVLRGRKVALWPDNDVDGREYMQVVSARLSTIAASVQVIEVPIPLPPKGDAFEYFQLGGDVASLTAATPITELTLEFFAVDYIRVRYPTKHGVVTFDFDEMEKKTAKLDAVMRISFPPETGHKADADRLHLESNNATDVLRRTLEAIYGKDYGWIKILHEVFTAARDAFMDYDRAQDAFDIVPLGEDELFFHDALVPLNHVTILFGDRGSGKSYVAEVLCVCCALGEPYLGKEMPQGPVLFIDYEDNDRNFRRRIDRICAGLGLPLLPGLIHYLNLAGMPIADARRTVRKKIQAEGIVLVVVDSLVPATGGDPNDAEAAAKAMQAMRGLGCTVVALAHVPKNHGETQPEDPFGSSFYSNLSRRTWYVERVQEEAADIIDVGLYCKKVNDGPKPHPLAVKITFEGLNGPVRLTTQAIADVPQLQAKRPIKWQVWDVLSHGRTRTIADLTDELIPYGAEEKDRKALQKNIEKALRDAGRFVRVGQWKPQGNGPGRPLDLWGRAENGRAPEAGDHD
jgi:hypothetical protein